MSPQAQDDTFIIVYLIALCIVAGWIAVAPTLEAWKVAKGKLNAKQNVNVPRRES